MEVFKKGDLKSLTAAQAGPCVSIYLRTNVTGPDGQQGPVRLKNLLNQAEEKLIGAGLRPRDARSMLGAARGLLTDPLFWQEKREGLAVFISPETFRRYRLPLPLEQSLFVGGRFHFKPLLPLLEESGRFYILALSQNRVRLLLADRWAAEEVEMAALPGNMHEALNYDQVDRGSQVHSAATGRLGKQAAVFHGQGGQPDASKDDLAQFFRIIDSALHQRLSQQPAPLVLAGVEYLLPIYRKVNTYPHLAEKAAPGNADHLSAAQLHERAWPAVQAELSQIRDELANRYHRYAGTQRTCDDILKIVPAACQGRIETLFLDHRAQSWGRFIPQTNTVQLHASAEPADDELFDLAAVQTILHRGSVYTVGKEDSPAHATIAALLRY